LWEKEWGGDMFFSTGTSQSLGQIIFVRKHALKNVECAYESKRIVTISFETDKGKMFVVNAYAPNATIEKQAFYDTLSAHVNDLAGEKIVCGDFNCALDNTLDIISGQPHRKADVESFANFVLNCSLNDTFRMFHPDKKVFTWSRQNPFIARRLDYLLVSDSVFNAVNYCDVCVNPHSDHKYVEMNVKMVDVKRGPSYWKFNDSLLRDIHFSDQMNFTINNFCTDNADLEAQLKWDLCKVTIREACINYSTCKKRVHKHEREELECQLKGLDEQIIHNPGNDDLLNQRERCKSKFNSFSSSGC
jgi:exonuclease III